MRPPASASSAPARWAPASRSSARSPGSRRSSTTRRRGAASRGSSSAREPREGRRARALEHRGRGRRRGPPAPRAAALEGLAACDFVIEAAPERPRLKRELFEHLSAICGTDAVLATNTSSIPVTSSRAPPRGPSSVVGMHFFNPAPLMRLVEVIPGIDTSDDALEPRARARRGDGQARDRRARTGPASWSTAAAGRSTRRRCGCCRSGSRRTSRSTASAGWARASGWGRSS